MAKFPGNEKACVSLSVWISDERYVVQRQRGANSPCELFAYDNQEEDNMKKIDHKTFARALIAVAAILLLASCATMSEPQRQSLNELQQLADQGDARAQTSLGVLYAIDRGRGHDGTITSERTQAVAKEPGADEAQIPIIGFSDRRGNILRKVELPYYCNHYHANSDNSLLVGDEVDDIVLIDIASEKPSHTVLCRHGTSWRVQRAHPHPTFGWNDKRILFASDNMGESCNLYLLEL